MPRIGAPGPYSCGHRVTSSNLSFFLFNLMHFLLLLSLFHVHSRSARSPLAFIKLLSATPLPTSLIFYLLSSAFPLSWTTFPSRLLGLSHLALKLPLGDLKSRLKFW
ncbi:hypothetical protein F5888DRAFT_320136 [Russula emetica]|nr:hypothetical protein F5888DRAFT_320136 [Russula emetica]